jgi:2-haloacid dehalogenase
MLDLRNFEALTFDCYGTLIDWPAGILAVLRPFRDAHGIDATDEELLAAYGRAEAHIQRSYFRAYSEVLREVMKNLAVHYRVAPGSYDEDALSKALPSWKPYDDTNAALETLSQYYRLAILSNIDDGLFAETAKHFTVKFDDVITAQQVGAYKPAFRMFRTAKDRVGLHPSRILHVAQSLFHDIKPAKSMDWHAVWVDRLGEEAGAATHPGYAQPDLVVPDLDTLAAMVREQLGEPVPRAHQEHFYI